MCVTGTFEMYIYVRGALFISIIVVFQLKNNQIVQFSESSNINTSASECSPLRFSKIITKFHAQVNEPTDICVYV